MTEVNQTPESPQVPAGQSPALGAAPEAIEEKQAPATPELGGVFKGTNSKKPSKLLLWLLIVLGVIILAGGGYFAWAKYGDQIMIKLGIKEAAPTATTGGTVANTTATDETAGWKAYTNNTYGFSFRYPPDWTIQDNLGDPDQSSQLHVLSPNDNAEMGPSYLIDIRDQDEVNSLVDLNTSRYGSFAGFYKSTVSFAGQSATVISHSDNDRTGTAFNVSSIIFLKNNRTYLITSQSYADNGYVSNIDLIDSSFLFTD